MPITITGNYYIIDGTKYGVGGKYAAFTPNNESADLLPTESRVGPGDFVFKNYDQALKLLFSKSESGTATIVIDNYTLVDAPTEVHNSADLIQVKSLAGD